MPYCSTCGKEMRPTDNYCSNCGTQKDDVEFVNVDQMKQSLKNYTLFANIGHVLGIITLVLGFIPWINLYAWMFGIPGIVFSILGKKDPDQLDKCKKGLKRSIIGSVIGVVFTVLIITIWIVLLFLE